VSDRAQRCCDDRGMLTVQVEYSAVYRGCRVRGMWRNKWSQCPGRVRRPAIGLPAAWAGAEGEIW
jgi:hypothetical protein